MVFLFALAFALFSSVQYHELVQAWGREPHFWPIFRLQASIWFYWATLALPVWWIAGKLAKRKPPWLWFLLVQIPLSYGAGLGSLEWESWMRRSYWESLRAELQSQPGVPSPSDAPRDRSRDPVREGRRGRGRRGMSSSMHSMRLTREMVFYWGLLGVGAGVQSFLRRREEERRRTELELKTSRLEGKLVRSQLQALRHQIRPHFLFNSLNAVAGQIRSEDGESALKTLASLGDLLRATLAEEEKPWIALRDEIDIAERYLEVAGVRLGERLDYRISMEAAAGSIPVPAFILLPLVENAVMYGVAPLADGGQIRVEANKRGDQLILTVEDNGPGFSEAFLKGEMADPERERPCVGIRNCQRRLELLYPMRHQMKLENRQEGGARVILLLTSEPKLSQE